MLRITCEMFSSMCSNVVIVVDRHSARYACQAVDWYVFLLPVTVSTELC